MPYGRVTGSYLGQLAQRGKLHAQKTYKHMKSQLGKLNYAVDVGKRIYDVAQPMLQNVAPETAKIVTRGLTGYDALKSKVTQADSSVRNVTGQLAKRVPELGL